MLHSPDPKKYASDFEREQYEALASLNREKIIEYAAKYGAITLVAMAADRSKDVLFWTAVHRARLSLPTFDEIEKKESRYWLIAHGLEARGVIDNKGMA